MTGQPQIERLVLEPEPESDGPLIMRIGFLVAGGVAAAAASSVPGALRMSEGSVGLALEQWLVLSAVSTPLAVAAVAILRRARVGLRLLMGERASLLGIGLLWWAVIELAFLSVFGALLRKTTHHHALAGVTFAVFAAVSGILVALFAQRTTAMLVRGGPSVSRTALKIAAGCAVLGIVLVGARTARAEGMHTAAALVDALVFAVTTMIASSRMIGRSRPMAIAGLPVAMLLIVMGLTTLHFDPKLQRDLAETAPMFSFVSGLLGS